MRRFPEYRNKGVESLLYNPHHFRRGMLGLEKESSPLSFTWSPGRAPQVSPADLVPHHHRRFLFPFLRAISFVVWKTVTVSPRCCYKEKRGRKSDVSVGLSRMEPEPQRSRVEWCRCQRQLCGVKPAKWSGPRH